MITSKSAKLNLTCAFPKESTTTKHKQAVPLQMRPLPLTSSQIFLDYAFYLPKELVLASK